MLVISGTMNVEPSDRDALLEASKAVMADTLKEDGCHAYSFTPDILDPGVVHIFEKWESEAHLAPHITRIASKRKSKRALAGGMTIGPFVRV